jgi:hypothetical protein
MDGTRSQIRRCFPVSESQFPFARRLTVREKSVKFLVFAIMEI